MADNSGRTDDRGDSDAILADQVAYYRAAAARYDEWWERTGPFDGGPEHRADWEAEIAQVRAALDGLGPLGNVLEIAGGTGNWTQELAQRAASVAVVDTSPEATSLAGAKVAGAGVPVDWTIADIFAWSPLRAYDTVFFSFWLSHVPDDRFADFWRLVDRALAPAGRVFFVDNAHPDLGLGRPPERARRSGVEVEGISVAGRPTCTNLETGVSVRQLSDRAYSLVKVFWQPEPLTSSLASLGWSFDIATTLWAFIYGCGQRK
jgi:demethylmenaquinone methyltransferase/2-methoxy-6-polyprenyl-1,4-benzoquinol methylase